MSAPNSQAFHVTADDAGQTLAAALRRWLPGQTWSRIRKLIDARRVSVSGNLCLDPARRLKADELVKLLPQSAPKIPTDEQVKIRYLDMLIDELAKGKAMEKILRG